MLIAGNWKLNTTLDASVRLAKAVAEAVDGSECDVLVCPPFVSIDAVSNALLGTSVHVGAQDVSATDEGAFTGEVSAPMLRSVGCSHVIVGHSERRALFGETDAVVATKTARALAADVTPIVCVGETLDERRADRVASVVEGQLAGALGDLSADEIGRVVVAYEPVWAIGTGETASPEQAQEVHALIRAWLSDRASNASAIPILYGGSMKPGNAKGLLAQPDIDGGLIGGASLNAADFAAIVAAADEAE
jgi:triosephosphate isomerase